MSINNNIKSSSFFVCQARNKIKDLDKIINGKPNALEISALVKKIYSAQKLLSEFKRSRPFEAYQNDDLVEVELLQKQVHKLQKKVLKFYRDNLDKGEAEKLNQTVKQVCEQHTKAPSSSWLPGVLPPILLPKDPLVLQGMSRFARQHLLRGLVQAINKKDAQEALIIFKTLSSKDKTYLPKSFQDLSQIQTDDHWVALAKDVCQHLNRIENSKTTRNQSLYPFYNQSLSQNAYDFVELAKQTFGEEALFTQTGTVFRDFFATTKISDVREQGRRLVLQDMTHLSIGMAIEQLQKGINLQQKIDAKEEGKTAWSFPDFVDDEMDGSFRDEDLIPARGYQDASTPQKFYSIKTLLPTKVASKAYLENIAIASQALGSILQQVFHSSNFFRREDNLFDLDEAKKNYKLIDDQLAKYRLKVKNSFVKDCPNLSKLVFSNFLQKYFMAKQTRKIGIGNCGELSTLLFYYLCSLRISNTKIEVFQFKEGTGDHVFTVIGRLEHSNENDPSGWGEDAVIVDAWTRLVFPAVDARKYLKNYLGKLDDNAQPCLESYDPKKHVLFPVTANFYPLSYLTMYKILPDELQKDFVEEYHDFLQEQSLEKRLSKAKSLLRHKCFEEKHLKDVPVLKEIWGQLRFFVMGKILQRVEKIGDFYEVEIDDENI